MNPSDVDSTLAYACLIIYEKVCTYLSVCDMNA